LHSLRRDPKWLRVDRTHTRAQLTEEDDGGAVEPRTGGLDSTLNSTRGSRSPERGRMGTLRGSSMLPQTPEDVAGAWDCVAALGLPPHVRALLEDAKVAQARARRPTAHAAAAHERYLHTARAGLHAPLR
jgi:hypothetical protein